MSNSYETLDFRIVGVAPLILHNGQTADPQNPHSLRIAELTKKKPKTDADMAELSKCEWRAGLYIQDGAPCIPWHMLEATIVNGAKKKKAGMDAKAGMLVEDSAILEYDGPTDVNALWESGKFITKDIVRVRLSRVVRTRPIFREWAATVSIKFIPTVLNPKQIRSFLEVAGQQVGLGDWRPRYGRFTVE